MRSHRPFASLPLPALTLGALAACSATPAPPGPAKVDAPRPTSSAPAPDAPPQRVAPATSADPRVTFLVPFLAPTALAPTAPAASATPANSTAPAGAAKLEGAVRLWSHGESAAKYVVVPVASKLRLFKSLEERYPTGAALYAPATGGGFLYVPPSRQRAVPVRSRRVSFSPDASTFFVLDGTSLAVHRESDGEPIANGTLPEGADTFLGSSSTWLAYEGYGYTDLFACSLPALACKTHKGDIVEDQLRTDRAIVVETGKKPILSVLSLPSLAVLASFIVPFPMDQTSYPRGEWTRDWAVAVTPSWDAIAVAGRGVYTAPLSLATDGKPAAPRPASVWTKVSGHRVDMPRGFVQLSYGAGGKRLCLFDRGSSFLFPPEKPVPGFEVFATPDCELGRTPALAGFHVQQGDYFSYDIHADSPQRSPSGKRVAAIYEGDEIKKAKNDTEVRYRLVIADAETGANAITVNLGSLHTDFEVPTGYPLRFESEDRIVLGGPAGPGIDAHTGKDLAAAPAGPDPDTPQPLPAAKTVLGALGLASPDTLIKLVYSGESAVLPGGVPSHGRKITLVSAGPRGMVALLDGGAVEVIGTLERGALFCRRDDVLVPWDDPEAGCRSRFEVKGALARAFTGTFDWLKEP